METFLLALAALFSVINPPGTAVVFLSMTKYASVATRRSLARRVALNSFFVMTGSLLIGALVLKLYGISVPVLRVAGGMIVAASGWKLLNEGTRTAIDATTADQRVDYSGQAFYPMTLPLTTGAGTIAVMISLGLSRSPYSDRSEDIQFLLASLLATAVIAAGIYVCFCLLGSDRTTIGKHRDRYRRPALCIHPVLSRRSNHLERSKRSSGKRAIPRDFPEMRRANGGREFGTPASAVQDSRLKVKRETDSRFALGGRQ